MSFSFTAAGSPKDIIAEVGRQAAALEQVPNGFADSLNDQLGRLPEDAEVTLSCYGHTGWHEGQTSGQISLHAQMDVRITAPRPVEKIVDKGPEPQPGPERFPKGFKGDTPPGPSASDAS